MMFLHSWCKWKQTTAADLWTAISFSSGDEGSHNASTHRKLKLWSNMPKNVSYGIKSFQKATHFITPLGSYNISILQLF